ncbi:protein of unknown function (plasmid) [Rhodovastum atsumiense]|nr:protein of unknown function [Rhodovastum atsumiense]
MDHLAQVWSPEDLSFELVNDLTSDPVVTITVQSPVGTLRFMAEAGDGRFHPDPPRRSRAGRLRKRGQSSKSQGAGMDGDGKDGFRWTRR